MNTLRTFRMAEQLAIIVFSLSLLAGCSSNKMDFYDQTKSTALQDERLKSISLRSNESDVVDAFGKPDSVNVIGKPKSKYLIYGDQKPKSDVEFQIVNGHVVKIIFSTEDDQTVKGISYGDSKEKCDESLWTESLRKTEFRSKDHRLF